MATHKCPRNGCTKQVDNDQLTCAKDWYTIPKSLRNAIWRAWRNGDGAGSIEHTQAIAAAIDYLNRPQ